MHQITTMPRVEMPRAVLAAAICLATITPAGWASPSSMPAGTSPADQVAVEGLIRSARRLTVAPSGTPVRAGRLVAATKFAERLDPDNADAQWLLASIYESQGKVDLAANALAKCLAANSEDHSLAVRWLELSVAGMDNAEERTAFLTSLVNDQSRTLCLRSEAAVRWAEILHGQGSSAKARQALVRALELDGGNPTALGALQAMEEGQSDLKILKSLLGQLRSNPAAADVAVELAGLFSERGLYDQAVDLLDYAQSVLQAYQAQAGAAFPLATQQLSAMLDAGRARQAVEKFSPLLAKGNDDLDLQALMVEAYRLLGEDDKAEQVVNSMAARYTLATASDGYSHPPDAELAWFYLVTRPDAARAIEHASKAAVTRDDPVVQRILGAAELAIGQTRKGAARLKELVNKDVYAAALLAEYYFSQGNDQAARQAIQAGAAVTRGGPAFRQLQALAKSNDVVLAPAAGSDQMRKAFEAFDKRYLELGLQGERFLDVRIRPASQKVSPGLAIVIEADLINKGPIPIPLGQWGLASAVMSVHVEAASGDQQVTFDDMPLVIWPGPHWLAPGQTVTRKARLDCGALGSFLAARPLEEVKLTVTGMLDPIEQAGKFTSRLPAVKPPRANITRASLLGDFDRSRPEAWPEAYQRAIGAIVGDIKRGDLQVRVAAAWKIASLLIYVGRVDRGEDKLPQQLNGAITKPVLLSMLRAVLNDKSPVVRAEMLTALQQMSLEPSILMLLGPVIEDPSPLVRFRAAELIGLSKSRGREIVLEHLAGDGDQLVSMMARLFRPTPDRQPSRPGKIQ